MSKASYWQRGESLDYKNTTGEMIQADTIVTLDTRIGIAGKDIGNNEIGSLHVVGVYEMPKLQTDDILFGAAVYYDGTQITLSQDGNTPAGYAVQAAGIDTTKVLVKLLG
ncbi:putative RecA/RadA family phage recombinase [Lachnotalea glycerini]|uniref:Putative RecA/RadA family phage recombinase n=1 Tax=Lachnotalea glycerini TaxID=1763509 RepID=A0A318ETL7_9FIRM|nr:DUF2190 family protein [Lachnotalea glycerini]OYO76214.1 hypothetical protein CG709_15645 [Lachnotalea glycerini]PXV87354.1 putative RecA/RadA family phage recombinase [Lachnotalea glycerini]